MIAIVPVRSCWKRPKMARGRPTTMPAKMMSEMPLPMPALGDLLAEPHDEDRAGRQREHGHEAEAPARMCGTSGAPPGAVCFSSQSAMPIDWMNDSSTVP